MSSERRLENRQPCFLRAEIHVNNARMDVPAEAHDISEHGLLLKLRDTSHVPDEFTVRIPRRHYEEEVVVRRRTPDQLGVILKRFAAVAG
jgi:PilZ domain